MSESPVWDVERMRPVVLEWDAALRAEMPAYARLVPEAEARGSVLRPPATAEDLAATEARIGVRLPRSYQSFLLISNGSDAGPLGLDRLERLMPTRRNSLLSAGAVVPLAEADPSLVQIWMEGMHEFADRQRAPTAEHPVEVYDFEPGLGGLLLVEPQQNGIAALVPCDGEWQVWRFFHESVIAYQSFASFLQHEARQARSRAAERAKRVAGWRADGTWIQEVFDLAEHGDPRAVSAGCAALLDDRHPDDVKVLIAIRLGLLGDATAVPALYCALDQTDHDGLRFSIVKALDSCGDAHVVDLLAEMKRAASPKLRCWIDAHLEHRP